MHYTHWFVELVPCRDTIFFRHHLIIFIFFERILSLSSSQYFNFSLFSSMLKLQASPNFLQFILLVDVAVSCDSSYMNIYRIAYIVTLIIFFNNEGLTYFGVSFIRESLSRTTLININNLLRNVNPKKKCSVLKRNTTLKEFI
jgi:hypothetical protein